MKKRDTWDNAMPKPELPKLVYEHDHAGTHYETYEHPAYAIIGASRYNGSMPLFQSKVGHTGFIVLTIRRAQLQKDHLEERTYGREELIELAMSEAQWVALVSRMNHGEGTPCTLRWTSEQGYVPEIAERELADAKLARMADATGAKLSEEDQKHDDELRALIEEVVPKKKQHGALFNLECLMTRSKNNSAFYRQQLRETAEKLTTEARIEIDAMLNGAITNLGLESAQQLGAILAADPKKAILLIADQNKKDEL